MLWKFESMLEKSSEMSPVVRHMLPTLPPQVHTFSSPQLAQAEQDLAPGGLVSALLIVVYRVWGR